MPQTDLLQTDDMEEGLDLNFLRFNDGKKEHGDANHKQLSIATSTYGGTTQSLALSADNVSEYFRRAVFRFESGATGAFQVNVPTEQRIFYVDNVSGVTVTIDTTGGASTAVTIPSNSLFQIEQITAGDFKILDQQESTVSANRPFDLAAYFPGKFNVSQLILKYVYPRTVTIGLNFPLSQGHYGTAPAGAVTFEVEKNGTTIGNITFSSASQTATFTSTVAQVFNAGDVLEITAPATTDSAGADISFTLAGVRS